jgi:hypothetical protein
MADDGIFTAILLQPVGGQIELKLESLLGRISVMRF